MLIAFVNRSNEKRVLTVDMGEEVDSMSKMSDAGADFINFLCAEMNWMWEPVKQVHSTVKVLSFNKLKELFNGFVH